MPDQFPPSQAWPNGQQPGQQPTPNSGQRPWSGQYQPLLPGDPYQSQWPGGQLRPPRQPRRGNHRVRNVVLATIGAVLVLGIIGLALGSGQTGHHPAASSSPISTPTSGAARHAPALYTSAQRRFFRDVNRYVPTLGAADNAVLLRIGQAACALRRTGISQKETISEQTFPNLTTSRQRARIVRLAEADLCPAEIPHAGHGPKLLAPKGSRRDCPVHGAKRGCAAHVRQGR